MNMKKIIFVFCTIIVAFNSCKEIGPDINLGGNKNSVSDTTYIESPVASAELKNVLIEEFTGVRCPNCPQGHQIIAGLKTTYADRVVSVSLHPINSLGAPYAFSAQDFRSPKAQSLFDYLGQIGLQPAAAVDRKKFSGESNILLDKNKWNTNVANQFAISPPVNLLLDKSLDTTNNELTVFAELHYTQNVSELNKLTLLLTESDIVTSQLDGSIIDTFYVHKDIMRDYVTDTKGDVISGTTEAGRVIRKVYKKVLDAAWKPENMHLVGFVHEYQNTDVVYQSREIKIK
jgi:hypothetical protein